MSDEPDPRLAGLEAGARRAGEALARAFAESAAEGRRLDAVLRDIERTMAGLALRSAVQTAGQLAAGSLAGLAGIPAPLANAALPDLERLLGARDAPARAPAPARPVSVSVQIATPDAASFRRSEAQVAASLARAVQRGTRAM